MGDFSLPPGALCINQIVVHNLHSSISNFSGQLQTGNVIIALQLVPKAIFLVVDVLFHDVILQIRLIPAIQSLWMITKAEGRQLPYEVPPLGGVFLLEERV